MLSNALRQVSDRLRSSFEATGVVEHALTKGEYREDEATNAFRPLIPARYNLTKGVIFNASGEQSKQQDIIITDTNVVSAFISSGTLGFHPIEAVVGTLQIKSRADPDEIRDGVKNIASMKKLLPGSSTRIGRLPLYDGGQKVWEGNSTPFGGILCLTSRSKPETLGNTFYEACTGLTLRNRPNALVVLNEFAMMWGEETESGPRTNIVPKPESQCLMFEAAENTLLFFYYALAEFFRQYLMPPLNMGAYLRAGGFTFTTRQWPEE
jgi:Domain of unknown function (DUF6602)